MLVIYLIWKLNEVESVYAATGCLVYNSPAMNKKTPIMPIKLPMNSTVSLISPTSGVRKIAIKKPVMIIGIPIPTVICLDAIFPIVFKIVYEGL